MREAGNLPPEFGTRELHRLEQVALATSQLGRLAGDRDGSQPCARSRAEVPGDRFAGRRGVKRPDHDDHQIVRHIARPVVAPAGRRG